MSSEDDLPLGCWIILIIVGGGIWWAWSAGTGCFAADQFDYVTKKCALEHLQRPDCNSDRDILSVDELTDASYKDDKGYVNQVRTLIYSFHKRPTNGPVSDVVMRDNASLFKIKTGQWLASCESLPSK